MGLLGIEAQRIQRTLCDRFLDASQPGDGDINGIGLGNSPKGGQAVAVTSEKELSASRKQEIIDCAAEILKRQPADDELIFMNIGQIRKGL